MAMRRSGNKWCEAHRVLTNAPKINKYNGIISCALSDSRVLIGQWYSKYLELFRVESGPHISFLYRITITKQYTWFSAKFGSDTLVAMSYNSENLVRVHILHSDRLRELARITIQCPSKLLWLADRLLATEWKVQLHSVIELELSGTQIKRRSELISQNEGIRVWSWCAVGDGFTVFDWNSKDILHYKIQ